MGSVSLPHAASPSPSSAQPRCCSSEELQVVTHFLRRPEVPGLIRVESERVSMRCTERGEAEEEEEE